MKVGIVGLPNVGKSTIFNALTESDIPANNYPFCTIEPNSGIVQVPDKRLDIINSFIETEKIVPTLIEFVDIAGLVKGASQGEGLGNQFLSNIRNVDAIIHVVRCFEDNNITHVEGSINPLRDIEIIETELIIKDIETIEKRIQKVQKHVKAQDKDAIIELKILQDVLEYLNSNQWVYNFNGNSLEREIIKSWFLLTDKPVIYVCNIDESQLINQDHNMLKNVIDFAHKRNFIQMQLCGNLEMEISQIDDKNEKSDFLESYNLESSGLDLLILQAYKLLGLITFFTAGEKEIRAWTIPLNILAPQAAGVIHTDFETGFIKAEIYHIDDLERYQSEQAIKEQGKIRIEGKNYIMQDGDIVLFRFNV